MGFVVDETTKVVTTLADAIEQFLHSKPWSMKLCSGYFYNDGKGDFQTGKSGTVEQSDPKSKHVSN